MRRARRRSKAPATLALVEGLKARGHRAVHAIETPEQLAPLVRKLATAGRHRDVPGRRHHHAMGLCAAGPARGLRQGRRVMAQARRRGPAEAPAGGARPAGGQCAAGGPHLVPRGRPGGSAVHARGRGRSRGFPARPRRRTFRSM